MRRFGSAALAAAAFSLLALPALATPAAALLSGLKLPVGGKLAPLSVANAIGQTSLNGQVGSTPETLFVKVRTALEQQGYKERAINTVTGAWGFNLVMDPPSGTSVDGTSSGKTAALILQSTALGPGKLNLNVRFEGL